jgi:MFS family permease
MSTTTTSTITQADPRAIELDSIAYPTPTALRTSLKTISSIEPLTETNISSDALTTTLTIPPISKWKATLIISTVASVSLIADMAGGIVIVALPTMAKDIGLQDDLLLWPASVSALSCGCTLLLSGSIADVVGGRKIYLSGALLLTSSTIAIGLSRTGIELIIFRAVHGVALSLTLPAAVILVTSNIPEGTGRNIAFAALGASQPLGFACGLVLGGVFAQSIGWRWGFYTGGILTFAVFVISYFGIPGDPVADSQSASKVLQRLKTEIDWIGISILSTCLGILSYVLSVLANGASHFVAPVPLTLFSIAILLLPTFAIYSRHQERLGRKIVIPPSIWNNRVFTCLCITIFIMFGIFDVMLFFLTLFFQSVQGLWALDTSIRFLPVAVTGLLTNFLTGWLVKRTRADVLILCSTALASLAPLLMAIVKPEWSYWTCAFIAVASTPACVDVLFTVANLVITQAFPPQTHGLAGGVFNTISCIGNSFALAIMAVIASSVTLAEKGKNESTQEMLMDGYRVTFWVCFGANIAALAVIAFGLRNIGKVGLKQE